MTKSKQPTTLSSAPSNNNQTNVKNRAKNAAPASIASTGPIVDYDPSRKYTVIRGVGYDITDFISKHPGGDYLVSEAIGRDGTVLFESYHVREYNETMLATLPRVRDVTKLGIEIDKGPFPNDSPFYRRIKERVRKEVLGNRSQRGGLTVEITVTLIALLIGFYFYYSVNSYLSALFMGALGAHIGMTLNHCGNHGGLTKYPKVNFFFGFANDLIGGSSLVWCYHHHVSHHVHCNSVHKDQDVFSALPLLRFDRRLPKGWWSSYQHIYMGFLFPFLFVGKHISDATTLLSGETAAVKLIGATSLDYQLAWLGKFAHFFFGLLIPMYFHGFSALWKYVVYVGFGSVILSWLFAISHNLEDTKDLIDDVDDWAKGQVKHSANYGGKIASFFTGGLNLQIEHHLFPAMAYNLYPKIAPIVKEECRKHGVSYCSYSNVLPMIRDFIKFMDKTGKQ